MPVRAKGQFLETLLQQIQVELNSEKLQLMCLSGGSGVVYGVDPSSCAIRAARNRFEHDTRRQGCAAAPGPPRPGLLLQLIRHVPHLCSSLFLLRNTGRIWQDSQHEMLISVWSKLHYFLPFSGSSTPTAFPVGEICQFLAASSTMCWNRMAR